MFSSLVTQHPSQKVVTLQELASEQLSLTKCIGCRSALTCLRQPLFLLYDGVNFIYKFNGFTVKATKDHEQEFAIWLDVPDDFLAAFTTELLLVSENHSQ